jgi:hypothetical protein
MQSMRFRISGRVYEQESGLGVEGLIIRAYDKDLLYDDLLGTIVTGDDGHFQLSYTESDFRELFDRQPDVYLSIYAPPYQFLMDTKDAVRWNAGSDEKFEVSIPRRVLGDHAPTRPNNQVEVGIALPRNLLKIEKRGGFDVPRLPGFATTGTPGAPAVPHQMRYVALPLGGDVLEFQVIPGEAVRLAGPFDAFPAQAPFPDRDIPIEDVHFQMTLPNPEYFEARTPYPASLAELVKIEEVGPLQIVAVQVRPVQYDPATRSYLYYPNLKYVVTFDSDNAQKVADARRAAGTKIGELQAEDLNDFLQTDRVAVAQNIFWVPVQLEDTPHLIITDNYEWPESIPRGDGTIRPPGLSERGAALTNGDLVTEFQRLANWRTSQGVRSKVVTISQIVAGMYGDFTQNGFARDLPEVIRNFLKHAHAEWDTRYAVLGGDVNVVPMRRLIGMGPNIIEGGAGVLNSLINPPLEGRCHFLKGHSVSKLHPNPKYCHPTYTDPLSTHHGGLRVPYNREAGPGNLGWYYTTEDDFKNLSEGFTRLPDTTPTEFIIVEGPESVIDDDFYWALDVNSIPSDFYYASLVGPGYSLRGKHDFDYNNNCLYGQAHHLDLGKTTGDDTIWGVEKNLDKVQIHSDVWVGRVPAESAAEVRAFVDKVITYESLKSPGTSPVPVDVNYLSKVLYAAEFWERQFQFSQGDTTKPPEEGTFTHIAGTTVTAMRTKFKIKLVKVFGSPLFPFSRLVAVTGSTQTIIPYDTNANATNAGWFFCTDNTYATQSSASTDFIKVVGPEATINPDHFFWDPLGLEKATVEKEHLRQIMDNMFPTFDNVQRHYSDYFDLTAPPLLIPLEKQSVRKAINSGQHFVSLSGHGGPSGCCQINAYPLFTNNHQYFIAFANSCSTARPDGVDSLGEVSVSRPDGGALAYVGFSRMGFCGVGDNYEEVFWCMLSGGGRIGPAAGIRVATDNISDTWMEYTITFYGDPAMRVWNHVPKMLDVNHKEYFQAQDLFLVAVGLQGVPVRDARVTLTGSNGEKTVFLSKKTNPEGRATFILPPAADRLGALQVTVWSREGRLYQGVVHNSSEIPQ